MKKLEQASQRLINGSAGWPVEARGISSVVERLLSMHEVVGSIPTFSSVSFCLLFHDIYNLSASLSRHLTQ